MCPSLDMSPAPKSTGYHAGGVVMGGRAGTRLLRLPGRGLHWEPAENRKSLNRPHASHQKTIKLKLQKEMGLHKVSCAKWKSLDFILESYRGLWKDFKHGNGISKKISISVLWSPDWGHTMGRKYSWAANPRKLETISSYRVCEREEGEALRMVKKRNFTTGQVHRVCVRMTHRKSAYLSGFRSGRTELGGWGEGSVPRMLIHKREDPCLDPQSPYKTICEDTSVIQAFLYPDRRQR